MPDLTQILGTVAGAMTTLAFVPQVIKVWRTRSVADISTSMYLIFITGLLMWIAYGWCIGSGPIIVANVITAILAGSVLLMKIKFRERIG